MENLRALQKRREWPTRMTPGLQSAVQHRVLSNVLRTKGTVKTPWAVKLLGRYPVLRRLPARIIGMGFRPEHIRH